MTRPENINVTVRDEDGSLWATVEEYPGVFAAGDNLEELRQSLEEGIALMLAEAGDAVPTITLAPLHPAPAQTTVSTELVYA